MGVIITILDIVITIAIVRRHKIPLLLLSLMLAVSMIAVVVVVVVVVLVHFPSTAGRKLYGARSMVQGFRAGGDLRFSNRNPKPQAP